MSLFGEMAQEILRRQNERDKKLKIRFIGRREDLSSELLTLVNQLEQESAKYETGSTIWIAFSYGGRAEIVEAVNQAVAKGESVDEIGFQKLLWSADLPEIDLIIRTGGDNRLSNFMTWHSVYSELVFTDTYWPAFTKAEFERILSLYVTRERRYGK